MIRSVLITAALLTGSSALACGMYIPDEVVLAEALEELEELYRDTTHEAAPAWIAEIDAIAAQEQAEQATNAARATSIAMVH